MLAPPLIGGVHLIHIAGSHTDNTSMLARVFAIVWTSAAECLATEIYLFFLTISELPLVDTASVMSHHKYQEPGWILLALFVSTFYSCIVSSVPCTPQTTTSAVLVDDNGVLWGRGLGWLCSPLYTISATWPSIVVSTFLFAGQLGCVHL